MKREDITIGEMNVNYDIVTCKCSDDPEEKDELTGGELPEEDDEENNP